jgi:ornithine lipid ester-linked acyl 2-hydroxylase
MSMTGSRLMQYLGLNQSIMGSGLSLVCGFRVKILKRKAPITSRLCSSIPGAVTFGFSVMRPGCVIERHTGYSKAVLRVHLGIHTNTSAAIEVCGEERTWKAGQLLMFDDTQVHSAWNRGMEDRVLLLVDVNRDAIESYLL